MNQTLLIAVPIWVPPFGLSRHLNPGIWACTVPSLTTASIIVVTAPAVDGFMTTDCTRAQSFPPCAFRIDHAASCAGP